jgi:hypothetical protein
MNCQTPLSEMTQMNLYNIFTIIVKTFESGTNNNIKHEIEDFLQERYERQHLSIIADIFRRFAIIK